MFFWIENCHLYGGRKKYLKPVHRTTPWGCRDINKTFEEVTLLNISNNAMILVTYKNSQP